MKNLTQILDELKTLTSDLEAIIGEREEFSDYYGSESLVLNDVSLDTFHAGPVMTVSESDDFQIHLFDENSLDNTKKD